MRTEAGAGGGESQRPPEAAPPGEVQVLPKEPGEVPVLPKGSCPRKHAISRPGELNVALGSTRLADPGS